MVKNKWQVRKTAAFGGEGGCFLCFVGGSVSDLPQPVKGIRSHSLTEMLNNKVGFRRQMASMGPKQTAG